MGYGFHLNRLLPKSLFAWAKASFDKCRASRRSALAVARNRLRTGTACPKLALRAQTVDIAALTLRQHLLAKNALMPAQRNFSLGNSPLRLSCVSTANLAEEEGHAEKT